MKMNIHSLTIRDVKKEDNVALAQIIRNTLTEFGANRQGTVFYDASTDAMYELFQTPQSAYFVAELNGVVVGGAGIFPTEGLAASTCELVKMYLVPEARGLGIGYKLIQLCEKKALSFGYNNIYLESMPELKQAIGLYEKQGFVYLTAAMGSSVHFGCNVWMHKKISN